MAEYQSRFGASADALAVGNNGGIESLRQQQRPFCNPCKENDCGRCATVLGKNGVVDSNFPCACYHSNPDRHEDAFDERQMEFEAEQEARRERWRPYWDDEF